MAASAVRLAVVNAAEPGGSSSVMRTCVRMHRADVRDAAIAIANIVTASQGARD